MVKVNSGAPDSIAPWWCLSDTGSLAARLGNAAAVSPGSIDSSVVHQFSERSTDHGPDEICKDVQGIHRRRKGGDARARPGTQGGSGQGGRRERIARGDRQDGGT